MPRRRKQPDHKRLLEAKLAKRPHVKRQRQQHPNGMEPGVRMTGSTGEVVAKVKPGQDPAWDEILTSMGFGGVLDVVEVTEVRAWGNSDDLRHYVKAKVARKADAGVGLDVQALCDEIRDRAICKPVRCSSERALVVAFADWQLGKRDGDGVKGTVDRIMAAVDGIADRIEELRNSGKKVQRLVLAYLGDLVEGCGDHYPMQQHSVQLDRREQLRIVRRLIVETICKLAPLAPEVVVACVGGNHGENRKNGKAYTSFGDNDDVAVVEQAADVCAFNERLEHVSFVVPDQDLTVTLDVFGTVLALAHGHQARKSGQQKLLTWWRDMSYAKHPVGDADVLLTGHYHHLRVVSEGKRTWIQAPTVDGGSEWWEAQGGCKTQPGTLTLCVGEGVGPAGWADMQVLA